MELRNYSYDETIIEKGQIGSEFFIIVQGQVQCGKIQNGSFEVTRNLGKGCHFGEIALLNNFGRTMTVKALDDMTVLCISKTQFVDIADQIVKNLKFDHERDRNLYKQARSKLGKESQSKGQIINHRQIRKISTNQISTNTDLVVQPKVKTLRRHNTMQVQGMDGLLKTSKIQEKTTKDDLTLEFTSKNDETLKDLQTKASKAYLKNKKE